MARFAALSYYGSSFQSLASPTKAVSCGEESAWLGESSREIKLSVVASILELELSFSNSITAGVLNIWKVRTEAEKMIRHIRELGTGPTCSHQAVLWKDGCNLLYQGKFPTTEVFMPRDRALL